MRACIFAILLTVFFNTHQSQAAPREIQMEINEAFAAAENSNYEESVVQDAVLTLTKSEHPAALAAGIVLLQFESGKRKEIESLFAMLGERIAAMDLQRFSDLVIDVTDYDGTDASAIDNLLEIQGLGYRDIGWGKERPGFEIPCQYFRRHPSVARLTVTWFGPGRWEIASFPIACEEEDFQSTLPKVFQFWNAGKNITVDSYNCGTIYGDHSAHLKKMRNKVLYRPRDIYKDAVRMKIPSQANLMQSNLFDWALMGRSNYRTFLEVQKLYESAFVELESYYVDFFDMSIEEAHMAVPLGLLSQLLHARFSLTFSRAMDASLAGEREIRRKILGGQLIRVSDLPPASAHRPHPTGQETMLWPQNELPKSGWPEPLMHLAVHDHRILKKMIEKGYDIEVRDAVGKTPLMAAVQDNQTKSVELLLKKGADVHAKSYHPENVPYNWVIRGGCETAYNIKIGERTALMYALSEASSEVAEYLMLYGARLDAIDSAGNTIADYLGGQGPLGHNPKLSEKFKAELRSRIDEVSP